MQVQSLWHGVINAPERPRAILTEVARRHGLTLADLQGRSQQRRIAWPRQEAMYELRERTTLSLPAIGRRLGGRDHTTIIHGVRRHRERLGQGT